MSEDDSEDVPQLPRASSLPTEASSSRVRVNREEKQVQPIHMSSYCLHLRTDIHLGWVVAKYISELQFTSSE